MLGVKCFSHEKDDSPPALTEVMHEWSNKWSYASIPPTSPQCAQELYLNYTHTTA